MHHEREVEPRWHASIAVLAAIVLYVTLPPRFIVGPLWLAPVLLLIILVPLTIVAPRRSESRGVRIFGIVVVCILTVFNVLTLATLVDFLLHPHPARVITGPLLMQAAVQIWLTNVIVYALWYWEIDGGGPDVRTHWSIDELPVRASFMFPQLTMMPELRRQMKWRPRLVDYVFLSFNTATAFSPTDTFPLTPNAKVLMMAEGLISLVTIAVIAGRAVNILGG